MSVTPELKAKFHSAFARVMRQTPPELQKRWDGNIEWLDTKTYPVIDPEIIKELPPGAKSAYIILLNKLSRGSI